MARSFIRPSEKPNSGIHESVVQLQGSHDWKDVWSQLVVFADTNGLNHIMLDVNAPWMHEGFHGVWRQKNANNSGNHQWLVELPMIVDGRILGRIKAFCPKDKNINHHSMVIELLDIVRGIEELLSEMHQSGEFLPKAIETASTNEVDKLVDSESIALPR